MDLNCLKFSPTAVMGVVYPGVEPFLDDYFSSLASQDYSHFDVVIFNDKFPSLSNLILSFPSLNIIQINMPEGTISTKREWALRQIKELGYEQVIFTDCDDFFSKDRVGQSVKALSHADIVFNDFIQVDRMGNELFPAVFRHRNITSDGIQDLHTLNFLGFSNTSINISKVTIPQFPSDLVAVDWFFFTVLLLGQSLSLFFIDQDLSYYRSYGDNFGFRKKVTPKYLKRVYEVKQIHYRSLLQDAALNLPLSFADTIRHALQNLKRGIQYGDQETLESLTHKINKENTKLFLWWEALS